MKSTGDAELDAAFQELEDKINRHLIKADKQAARITELEAAQEKVDADYFALDSAWSEQCEQLTAQRDHMMAVVEAARKLTDFWVTGYGYHKEDLYPEELALLEAVSAEFLGYF